MRENDTTTNKIQLLRKEHKSSTSLMLPPVRTPNHKACLDDSVQGIYHIAMGDIGGAAGTIFYQFVIAQILYAERNGLKPWVHLSNVSHVVYDPLVHNPTFQNGQKELAASVEVTALVGRNATYQRRQGGHHRDFTPGPPNSSLPVRLETMQFVGTGVWEHYFAPVSDFAPGDHSCSSKLYVTMDLYLITPGLHGYAEYAPRCWRYKYMPDYMTKPHLGVTEWLEPQRRVANNVIRKYIRPLPFILAAATKVNPDCSLTNPCLGLHIRHSDKASGRRIVDTLEFLPYAQAFVQAATDSAKIPHIYLATDSSLVLQDIVNHWPSGVQAVIRTAGNNVLRSNNSMAVFDLDGTRHHNRANQEVLIEILALSTCQFMVHGFSAVSESAVWNGLHLHNQSVNLEDPEHLTHTKFGQLVTMVLTGGSNEFWPRPIHSVDIWPEMYGNGVLKEPKANPSHVACNGYDGVLLISSAGQTASAGAAFFTGVLNQLIYADTYNLKPWIHLRSNANVNIYDEEIHKNGRIEFDMMEGMAVGNMTLDKDDVSTTYPSEPKRRKNSFSQKRFSADGNGIWNSYFEPVSDFMPEDESCRILPLMEMNEVEITGLQSYAPWAIRAWRYDRVPERIWWTSSMNFSLSDFYRPMRLVANQVLLKYFRFRPYIVDRSKNVLPDVSMKPCLGIHLRNGDKFGKYREKIRPGEFEEYVTAFERAGGRCVYIAADSHRALRFVLRTFPDKLKALILSQGENVVRSTKLDWPLHYLENHHRVNSEVLVDVLALSKCGMLLHGFSTVSEAAIYLNPILHENSVNLEDPGRVPSLEFERMAKRTIESAEGGP